MSRESTSSSPSSPLARVRVIADFQFGRGAGTGLFPDGSLFVYSRTGRIRQVLLAGQRLATVRASDGRLTLGIAGARRLREVLAPPAYRVSILPEVADFIRDGKNAFARHVVAADPAIRAGDEVLVVTGDDELCGTGTAVLSGEEMLGFNYGVAVKVRQGVRSHDAGQHQPEEDEADDEAAGDASRADRGRAANRHLDREGGLRL
ncbi:MAG: pseudouridine synthase [Methanolinea sp.]|nr:pseudouridine synthase [Methanolinea sp.]